jgi:hypothetical protein
MESSQDMMFPPQTQFVFRKRLEECGVKGDWLEWEKQLRCFPSMFPYHVREAIDAKDLTIDIPKSNVQQEE